MMHSVELTPSSQNPKTRFQSQIELNLNFETKFVLNKYSVVELMNVLIFKLFEWVFKAELFVYLMSVKAFMNIQSFE